MNEATIRTLLAYDPDTGHLTWLVTEGRGRVGARAGSLNKGGYRKVGIAGHTLKCSRIAWLFVHGQWPMGVVDHINGDKDDDRIANLRDVTAHRNNVWKCP